MISTTRCPASWNSRSLRSTTAWPRWMSGAVGSMPSFTRSGRPTEAACESFSARTPEGRESTAFALKGAAAWWAFGMKPNARLSRPGGASRIACRRPAALEEASLRADPLRRPAAWPHLLRVRHVRGRRVRPAFADSVLSAPGSAELSAARRPRPPDRRAQRTEQGDRHAVGDPANRKAGCDLDRGQALQDEQWSR